MRASLQNEFSAMTYWWQRAIGVLAFFVMVLTLVSHYSLLRYEAKTGLTILRNNARLSPLDRSRISSICAGRSRRYACFRTQDWTRRDVWRRWVTFTNRSSSRRRRFWPSLSVRVSQQVRSTSLLLPRITDSVLCSNSHRQHSDDRSKSHARRVLDSVHVVSYVEYTSLIYR